MNNNNVINKLAIIDFDGTLIEGQSQKLLINFFYKNGYLSFYKYIILMIWFILFKLNIFKNIKPIVEFATASIKDKDIEEVNNLFEKFYNTICLPNLYLNSQNLIDHLKSNGYYLLMISTAIDGIILQVQKKMKIDEIICTKLEIDNGRYTGKIVGEPIFSNKKQTVLKEYLNNNKVISLNIFSFADHQTDIESMLLVKNPVAVNPTPQLWKSAKKNNWPVIYLNDNESFQYFKSHTVL